MQQVKDLKEKNLVKLSTLEIFQSISDINDSQQIFSAIKSV